MARATYETPTNTDTGDVFEAAWAAPARLERLPRGERVRLDPTNPLVRGGYFNVVAEVQLGPDDEDPGLLILDVRHNTNISTNGWRYPFGMDGPGFEPDTMYLLVDESFDPASETNQGVRATHDERSYRIKVDEETGHLDPSTTAPAKRIEISCRDGAPLIQDIDGFTGLYVRTLDVAPDGSRTRPRPSQPRPRDEAANATRIMYPHDTQVLRPPQNGRQRPDHWPDRRLSGRPRRPVDPDSFVHQARRDVHEAQQHSQAQPSPLGEAGTNRQASHREAEIAREALKVRLQADAMRKTANLAAAQREVNTQRILREQQQAREDAEARVRQEIINRERAKTHAAHVVAEPVGGSRSQGEKEAARAAHQAARQAEGEQYLSRIQDETERNIVETIWRDAGGIRAESVHGLVKEIAHLHGEGKDRATIFEELKEGLDPAKNSKNKPLYDLVQRMFG